MRKIAKKKRSTETKATLSRGVKLMLTYTEDDTNKQINSSENISANTSTSSNAELYKNDKQQTCMQISDSESAKDNSSENTIIKHLIIPKKMPDKDKTKKHTAERTGSQRSESRSTRADSSRTTNKPSIELKNRFETLSEEEDTVTEEEIIRLTKPKRPRAPAPIIIAGNVSNHKELVGNIKSRIKHGFHIKYTANNISLYLDNQSDKDNILKSFNREQLEYHTYTDANQKTHAFIVRGLDGEPSTEEVKQELKTIHKIEVKQVYRLKNTVRPLYMIITDPSATLKGLQNNIRYLQYTKITWERYMNKKIIIQCHRCQQWGHATANCNRAPKCLKCAKEHWTRDCTKSPETQAECANCNGPHPANNVECPAYKRRLEDRERYVAEQHAPPKTKYVQAPLPKTNAWTTREPSSREVPSQVTMQPTTAQFPPLNKLSQVPPSHKDNKTLPQATPTDTTVILKELSNQYNILSSLVNLNSMLQAIKDLNTLLARCTNKADKLTTFLNFLQSIDSYDI